MLTPLLLLAVLAAPVVDPQASAAVDAHLTKLPRFTADATPPKEEMIATDVPGVKAYVRRVAGSEQISDFEHQLSAGRLNGYAGPKPKPETGTWRFVAYPDKQGGAWHVLSSERDEAAANLTYPGGALREGKISAAQTLIEDALRKVVSKETKAPSSRISLLEQLAQLSAVTGRAPDPAVTVFVPSGRVTGLSDPVKNLLMRWNMPRNPRARTLPPSEMEKMQQLLQLIYSVPRPREADFNLVRELLETDTKYGRTINGDVPCEIVLSVEERIAFRQGLPENLATAYTDDEIRTAVREARFSPVLTRLAWAGGAHTARLKTLWTAEEAALIALGSAETGDLAILKHVRAMSGKLQTASSDAKSALQPIFYEAFTAANAASPRKMDEDVTRYVKPPGK